MRYAEFDNSLKPFTGIVRVPLGQGQITVKLVLLCDGFQQARAIYSHLLGAKNIVAIVQTMTESNSNALKSPEALQVKAMSDQARQIQLRAKTVRARKSLDKAKQSLQKALNSNVSNQ